MISSRLGRYTQSTPRSLMREYLAGRLCGTIWYSSCHNRFGGHCSGVRIVFGVVRVQ